VGKLKQSVVKNANLMAEAERRRLEEFNDPENVEIREWIIKAFSSDINQIAHFAALLVRSQGVAEKENEALAENLNQIKSCAYALSNESEVQPYQKKNLANFILEIDPTDPIARTFLDSLSASRTLNAQSNAFKAHAHRLEAKKFVVKEWANNKVSYQNNKSEFSRHYVRIVLQNFGVVIKEKQMREVWLKDTPSAS